MKISKTELIKHFKKDKYELKLVVTARVPKDNDARPAPPLNISESLWKKVDHWTYNSTVDIYSFEHDSETYYVIIDSDSRWDLYTSLGRVIEVGTTWHGGNTKLNSIKEAIKEDIAKRIKRKATAEEKKTLQSFKFAEDPPLCRKFCKGVLGWRGTIVAAHLQSVAYINPLGKLNNDLSDPNNDRLGFIFDGIYMIAGGTSGSFKLFLTDDDKFYPVVGQSISKEFNSPYLKKEHLTKSDLGFLKEVVEAYKNNEDLTVAEYWDRFK